jgi:hypothetical protein
MARGCLFDASDNKDLSNALVNAIIELDDYDNLARMDSLHIRMPMYQVLQNSSFRNHVVILLLSRDIISFIWCFSSFCLQRPQRRYRWRKISTFSCVMFLSPGHYWREENCRYNVADIGVHLFCSTIWAWLILFFLLLLICFKPIGATPPVVSSKKKELNGWTDVAQAHSSFILLLDTR